MALFNFTDTQKIGVFLILCSLLFGGLGIVLFFDFGLLSLFNILLVMGIFMIIGFDNLQSFFLQSNRTIGTIVFFFGILMVLVGYGFLGFIVESIGFVNLFGNFFPNIFNFIKFLTQVGFGWLLPGQETQNS